jgi:hypothetical protein
VGVLIGLTQNSGRAKKIQPSRISFGIWQSAFGILFQSPMLDPFTQTSRAIVSALQADPGWSALVKPGNVIDMTADSFERFKTQVQSGDLPEVILLQGDFRLKPFGGSSRIAEMEQHFQLVVTHDSLRVRPVNLLKYHTLIALAKSGPTLGLDGLVRGWEIAQCDDDAVGQSKREAFRKQWRRGTQRWISIMTIQVNMFVARERLITL